MLMRAVFIDDASEGYVCQSQNNQNAENRAEFLLLQKSVERYVESMPGLRDRVPQRQAKLCYPLMLLHTQIVTMV